MNLELSGVEVTKNFIYSGFIIGLALIGRILAGILIRAVVKKVEDNDPNTNTALEQRAYTLAGLFRNIANIFIFGIMIVMLLSQWGINIAPILTGAGILGLAIGFGTQSLVRDIVTGFFILFENQYNVGDRIRIAGKEGVVKEMRLRTTIIVGDNGTIYSIPNSSVSVIEQVKNVPKNS